MTPTTENPHTGTSFNPEARPEDRTPSEHAVHFEAVKVALTQDKNGYVLKLSIHPNDVPETLLRDWVGSRYIVALVKTDDQGLVVENPEVAKGKKMVTMAGLLCANETFQAWLFSTGRSLDTTEDAAAVGLRSFLGITSRRELAHNGNARKKFSALVSAFEGEHARS